MSGDGLPTSEGSAPAALLPNRGPAALEDIPDDLMSYNLRVREPPGLCMCVRWRAAEIARKK